jgi:hypothetical protein
MVTDLAHTGSREAAQVLSGAASQAAAAAAARIARQLGAESAPVPGVAAHPRSLAEALRIARQLEYAARAEVRVHVRRAREGGQSWRCIGALIGFGAIATGAAGPTVAGMGFDYSAGPFDCARLVSRRAGVPVRLPGLRAGNRRPRPGQRVPLRPDSH